ncbi:ABC transporter permease [Kribbia dieselivorans]|uniref:ABC transporter permease n=1 Tax=Kribbia dieselivorans TaxID=331526 RepID=UPI000A5C31A7|nr:iron ABC transporter permease [Kribbia dieselivorans]
MTPPHLVTRRLGAAALALLPLAFLAVFFLLPVAGMLVRGFAPDGHLDLAGAFEVLTRRRTLQVIAFTAGVSLLGTVLTVALGVPTAYVLYRLDVPGRHWLRALIVMPFAMPTVVVGVMFRSLLAPGGPLGFLGLDGTWMAVVLALVFFNLAVVVRTVGTFWASLDPRTEEAAAALGASPRRVFVTVTLPALAPAILSAGAVVLLFCATAFGLVLTLGGLRYSTVETEIYLLTTSFLDLQGAAVLAAVQFVAVIALLWVGDVLRRRVEAAPRSARGGARTLKVRRRHWAVLTATAAVTLFVAAPIATLIVRSLRVGGHWSWANYRALGRLADLTAVETTGWAALNMSWRIAVDATLLALVLGLCVAVLVTGHARTATGRVTRGVFDAAFMLPLGVSAVTVGFGFLITLDRPPLDLRSSPILIPIAQALVALPLVVRVLVPALRGIDDRQRQAAATLGASPWRVWRTVDLPALWRPLLAATGFALAVSLGEFGATSFLARPDQPTLPVVIYQLISRPGAVNAGAALAASVVLAVTTSVVMTIVERVRVGSLGTF